MSDAPSEPPRPPRDGGERPSAKRAAPKRRAIRRPTEEELAAREAEQARLEKERFQQAVRQTTRDLIRNGPAFAISLGAHVLILIVLGMVVFRTPLQEGVLVLFSNFGVDAPPTPRRPAPR